MASPRAKLLVPGQCAVAAIALVAITMWPPSSGRMLLVPLANADVNAVARIAVAGGGGLIGPGPLPGSLVVIGQRSQIARQIRHWNIVIMAASPAGCGTVGPAAIAA